ncbi:phosphatase PAP2 family protein [Clostridium sp. A1-XYC3]|uniref:Phosphatase PAP2 family protein n=1 Tax=Clostridium tanneri TaxID=3037988 RepID=A0ABU4JS50_9CLOT|nr:phosphatase PAP2 family protein [Clostridium sp. A1-XYC3]MDW8800981.1 phosphatase PAP2 family protein [Clostridium sp. A1-XYC3]
MQSLQNMDLNLLRFIHDNLQNPILDRIVPFITYLGNGGILWITITVALVITKRYRRIGLICGLALLVNTIIGEGILKHLFQRQRPFVLVPTVDLIIPKPSSYSFPSGHTSTAFAAAGILATQFKKYRVPIIILAVLIALSRLYLFVHYPSDILTGVIVGLFSAKIVLRFYPSDKKYKLGVPKQGFTIKED